MAFFTQLLLLGLGLFLMIVILLQRGRGGGLAGAFGGLGGQSAFGTKAGDVFTKITVVLAVAWVLVAGGSGYFLRAGAEQRAQDLGDPNAGMSADEELDSEDAFDPSAPETPALPGEMPADTADDATATPPATPPATTPPTEDAGKSDADAATPPAEAPPSDAPKADAPKADAPATDAPAAETTEPPADAPATETPKE